MTAEIAVLNSQGIALAADSAVSIGSTKVYNSANKLFALTKKCPVGIMIYGNAQTMSVPWETLLKTYRLELKDKKFDTLVEYGNDFIKYLTNTKNIGYENEDLYLSTSINNLVSTIGKKIFDEDFKKEFESNKALTEAELLAKFHNLIEKYFKELTINQKLGGITDEWIANLKSRIKPMVSITINNVFENIPISEHEIEIILEACASIFYGDYYSNNHTGIVIAGFGEEEIYPSLISYAVEWRIMGYLKFHVNNEQKITVTNGASIVPFAQREMVDTFMEGSDRELSNIIKTKISEAFEQATNSIFNGTTTKVSNKNLKLIKSNCENIAQNIKSDIEYLQNRFYVQPVLASVAALPLDELASMAQTLINLTSFKRRVSLNTESVGGPIDVAVISKGDGFIWINRKHYFKPELNQHYFVNNS